MAVSTIALNKQFCGFLAHLVALRRTVSWQCKNGPGMIHHAYRRRGSSSHFRPRRGDYLRRGCAPLILTRSVPTPRICAAKSKALLAAHAQAGNFLQSPAPGLTTSCFEKKEISLIGAQIGPYKLLQQIGEGGMGIVYMAEQTQPVQRKVALKIIKPGMDTQAGDRPLRGRTAGAGHDGPPQHRQGARRRDHRCRPPVFRHGAGQGHPDHRVLRRAPPHPRERLELFIPVCQAMQHAHQKGIIHRDIKPSNVLVRCYDGSPVPKVIDFGVAKAIGQQLDRENDVHRSSARSSARSNT